MSKDNVISMEEYNTKLRSDINLLIEDATYSELYNYINTLPKCYEDEENLYYWGVSFINEYYKKMVKLESMEDSFEKDKLQHELYSLYLCERYGEICFSFKEFITFSKLLVVTFANYNPKKSRKSDKHPYKCGNEEIDAIINIISYSCNHSPKEHAFEITKYKLGILHGALSEKLHDICKEELMKIDLDNGEIANVLSENRLKELEKVKKRIVN